MPYALMLLRIRAAIMLQIRDAAAYDAYTYEVTLMLLTLRVYATWLLLRRARLTLICHATLISCHYAACCCYVAICHAATSLMRLFSAPPLR